MNEQKDKFINFIKSYVSFIVTLAICLIYLGFDLIKFDVKEDAAVVWLVTIIYLALSFTINSLMRKQGIINGSMDVAVVESQKNYDNAIDICQDESDRLDDWCEAKNEMKRIAEVKKRLKYAHLSFDKWSAGAYEIPSNKTDYKEFKSKYSKRQIKAIKWCNGLEVELYSATYLLSDMEKEGKKQIARNVSVSKFLKTSGGKNIFFSIASSIAFAYLAISLAEDISWANFIYSCIKVITWIGGGVICFITSFLFMITTFKDSLINKSNKLKEFRAWCNDNPKIKEEVVLNEKQNISNTIVQ